MRQYSRQYSRTTSYPLREYCPLRTAITSCGLIMAGTFATLMLAGLNTLVQVGFALAFGVLLDTFVVRPILVPAFLVLVAGRRPLPPARPEEKPSASGSKGLIRV